MVYSLYALLLVSEGHCAVACIKGGGSVEVVRKSMPCFTLPLLCTNILLYHFTVKLSVLLIIVRGHMEALL